MVTKYLVIELAVLLMGAVFGVSWPTESWKERLIAGGLFMAVGQLILLAV